MNYHTFHEKETAHCSPLRNRLRRGDEWSCYANEELRMMAQAIERYDKQASFSDAKTRPSLVEALKNYFHSHGCEEEACWAQKVDGVSLPVERIFRPKMPSEWLEDPDQWLSNHDIENVMTQYEEAYPDFAFLGAVPQDFYNCYPSSRIFKAHRYRIRYPHIEVQDHLRSSTWRKVTRMGVILNQDRCNEPGSHWVALMVDLRNPKRPFVAYFDSVGLGPQKYAREFLHRLGQDLPKNGFGPMEQAVNGVRHQREDTECGMYALAFLIRMLESPAPPESLAFFQHLCQDLWRDEQLLALRPRLFRTTAREVRRFQSPAVAPEAAPLAGGAATSRDSKRGRASARRRVRASSSRHTPVGGSAAATPLAGSGSTRARRTKSAALSGGDDGGEFESGSCVGRRRRTKSLRAKPSGR